MLSYILLSVVLISFISLIGTLFISINKEFLFSIMILLVSFAAGTMIGDVFIHILPEFIEENGFTLVVSLFFIIGVLLMFVVEKFLHYHHCHNTDSDDCHSNNEDSKPKPFAIMNLVGDFLHNFLDGVIIASSYLISVPVGVATTIAVALHEIPQEISDFAILVSGGFTYYRALLFNFLTALSAVLGAILTYYLSTQIESLLYYLVPLSAGSLLYVAMSDLIPQLHKETGLKTSIFQILFFILGICVMLSFVLME